jgi:hypothetical protein
MEEETKKVKCISCEQMVDEDDCQYDDEGKLVCESCWCDAEQEPSATVHWTNETDDDECEESRITEFHNPTPFKLDWVAVGWRGYYDVEGTGDWVNVHSDCGLAMSQDSADLETFDKKLEQFCVDNNIKLARVVSRTGNCCACGVDFFIQKQDVAKVQKLIDELKGEYRDDEKFNSTALTGADPDKQTETDKQFVKAVNFMGAIGCTPEDAVKVVRDGVI